ncbi:MAG: trans-2-enoyl-CoA reductase family protein [Spirochaetales bacterium]|nr:trans-2-enoyl-CoA reductase family protein [Spirochaetales bacterium]MCF7937877.1 trans-2-enoyl-CoA reductase family protein [Spirochaetales bacterium]
MIIKPKIRNNICMNAHPVGCAEAVRKDISYVKKAGNFSGPKNVLVVGASTGYGLAARISAAFGGKASTLAAAFEKEPTEKRPGTAGWYNTRAFEQEAAKEGLYAKSLNGDAFSHELKQQAIDIIKEEMGQVDLVIYSLASPMRTDPDTGETYRSVLKPIGETYTNRTLDAMSGEVGTVSIEPAEEQEIANTVKVMGGEDWMLWLRALKDAGVLSEGAKTVAFSYIGPELTYPVYRHGTIGKAKEHLEKTAGELNELLGSGSAFVSVNKAVVTRASAVIPVVPLYLSLLFRVMKGKGIHEGCIEQMYRLFTERLLNENGIPLDESGRIRIDDWEMREDVQKEINALWDKVTTENVETITDVKGYRKDFLQLHGFDVEGVDYDTDVSPFLE